MARWKNTLDIADPYQQAEAGSLTPAAFAAEVGRRMRTLLPNLVSCCAVQQSDFELICENFEAVGELSSADFSDDVDPLLSDLYELGDQDALVSGKFLWVRTQP